MRDIEGVLAETAHPTFTGEASTAREDHMRLTPREFDKLLVYIVAGVAPKRRTKV